MFQRCDIYLSNIIFTINSCSTKYMRNTNGWLCLEGLEGHGDLHYLTANSAPGGLAFPFPFTKNHDQTVTVQNTFQLPCKIVPWTSFAVYAACTHTLGITESPEPVPLNGSWGNINPKYFFPTLLEEKYKLNGFATIPYYISRDKKVILWNLCGFLRYLSKR